LHVHREPRNAAEPDAGQPEREEVEIERLIERGVTGGERAATNPEEDGDTVARIPLNDGKFSIVDAGDADALSRYVWFAVKGRNTFYVARMDHENDEAFVYMHRELFGAAPDQMIDHENRDGLDNRRSNLRLANASLNGANAGLRSDNNSGLRGVWRAAHAWKARVRVNGDDRRLGSFLCKYDAADAYDRAAKEAFGDFAYQNAAHSQRPPTCGVSCECRIRLADAIGVEPPLSDPMPAIPPRQAPRPSTRMSSPEPMAKPERAPATTPAPALLPQVPDPSTPWAALDARQKEAAVLPLAKRGFSAAVIAGKLGLDSRNQVVTVIHRLQKAGHLPPPMSRITAQRSTKRSAPSKPSRLLAILPGGEPKTNQYDFRQRAADRAASRGLPADTASSRPLRAIDPVAPTSLRLTILDLTDRTCRWPNGDPRSKEFSFCGNATDAAPYCQFHAQIAFVPVDERRARRQQEERIA
jgi:GcrA cell cycle regulator